MKSLRNSNTFCGYCDESVLLNKWNEKILTGVQNIFAVERILLCGIYLYIGVSCSLAPQALSDSIPQDLSDGLGNIPRSLCISRWGFVFNQARKMTNNQLEMNTGWYRALLVVSEMIVVWKNLWFWSLDGYKLLLKESYMESVSLLVSVGREDKISFYIFSVLGR